MAVVIRPLHNTSHELFDASVTWLRLCSNEMPKLYSAGLSDRNSRPGGALYASAT